MATELTTRPATVRPPARSPEATSSAGTPPAERLANAEITERLPEGLPEQLPDDPLPVVASWLEAAREALGEDHQNPTAMVLATVDEAGHPDARVVLCRGFDPTAGLVTFYTDRDSRKGAALAGHPFAALVFYWEPLYRQVRIRGPVRHAPEADSDAYFAGRPLGAQISASISRQSRPLASRVELVERHEQAARRLAAESASARVPRPARWGGYQIVAAEVELWAGRRDRLHDRARYTRTVESNGRISGPWSHTRLEP